MMRNIYKLAFAIVAAWLVYTAERVQLILFRGGQAWGLVLSAAFETMEFRAIRGFRDGGPLVARFIILKKCRSSLAGCFSRFGSRFAFLYTSATSRCNALVTQAMCERLYSWLHTQGDDFINAPLYIFSRAWEELFQPHQIMTILDCLNVFQVFGWAKIRQLWG